MKIPTATLKAWARALLIIFASLAGTLLLWITAKISAIYWVFGMYLDNVISIFGLDIVFSRMIAALFTIVTFLCCPWIASYFLFRTRKIELSIASAIVIIGGSFAIYYGSAGVFFDRATGRPVKYYVKTLDGYKFSNSPDFDPQFGIRYRPIDAQAIKDYYFWEKHGGRYVSEPKVVQGHYFDMVTGEPVAWYAERANGTRALFSLPGHDPLTGKVLKPITAEIAETMEGTVRQSEPAPTASSGWIVNVAGELVADLRPGEESTRPFLLQDGQSTPWIVIPPDNYDFRFTTLQTVIVEWDGQSQIVDPNEYLDLGKFGTKRLRLTALKGGSQISLHIKRR